MGVPATAAVRLLAGDKEPVRLATTGNITLSGLQTIDGVVTVAGNRILVKDQTDATQNGIYTASEGTWRRASDANNRRAITKGVNVNVQMGVANAGKVFVFDTIEPEIGSDDIDFIDGPSVAIFNEKVAAAQAYAEAAQSVSDAFARVPTLAALKALDTGLVTTAYLTLEGSEGVFNWRTGDYAARIAADTEERIYVKADAVASTSGAWVRAGANAGATDLSAYGVVGDGTTDNLTAVQLAIDEAGWRGVLDIPMDPLGGVYHCSAAPTNPKGVFFTGPGYIQIPEAVSGRPRRWDLRSEQYPHVEGQQYLAGFYEVLRVGSVAGTIIEWLGDSTTDGTGVTDTDYVVRTLVQNNLKFHGVNCIHNNRAVSGTTSDHVRTVQVPAVIAAASHLVIIRTGINDPYLRGTTPGGVNTEAETAEVAELVRVSLDAALAALRASFVMPRQSIILMTPSVATLTINGNDERYLEMISPMYRELARKYECTFIDTYRIWKEGRGLSASGGPGSPFLDSPFGANNGGVHPSESFNMLIADKITQTILPETMRRQLKEDGQLLQLNSGALTFSNGWSNLSGQSFRARRRGQIVQLEGTITPGTTTSGTTIATLPSSMWPARRRFFGCVTNATGQAPALMYVDTDGAVRVQTWPSGATNVVMESINYIVGD